MTTKKWLMYGIPTLGVAVGGSVSAVVLVHTLTHKKHRATKQELLNYVVKPYKYVNNFYVNEDILTEIEDIRNMIRNEKIITISRLDLWNKYIIDRLWSRYTPTPMAYRLKYGAGSIYNHKLIRTNAWKTPIDYKQPVGDYKVQVFPTISEFKTTYGNGSITGTVLNDKPEYYAPNGALKPNFKLPLGITKFDNSFGNGITHFEQRMLDILPPTLLDMGQYGRDLVSIPEGTTIDKSIIDLDYGNQFGTVANKPLYLSPDYDIYMSGGDWQTYEGNTAYTFD